MKHKSTRDAEKTLLAISPDAIPQEKLKVVATDKTLVTLVLSDDLMQKLERLKSLLSHKTSGGGYVETISAIADLALQKLDPEKRAVRNVECRSSASSQRKATPALESESSVSPSSTLKTSFSRYIPAAIKREVWRKSGGECEYQNLKTGVKCTSKHFLEIDHIQPRAIGGGNHLHNLQLLCDAHNRWKGTD